MVIEGITGWRMPIYTEIHDIGYLFGGHIDVSAGEDIEQLKTRMLTPGARTKRIALLDNVKTLRLSWAELEAMITSPIVSGRQLYVGEGQRPNLLTWFITLNGVSMATDMAQRSVIIKVVRGKNDGPWWEQTRQFIDQHRERLAVVNRFHPAAHRWQVRGCPGNRLRWQAQRVRGSGRRQPVQDIEAAEQARLDLHRTDR